MGFKLRPIANPLFKEIPLTTVRGQAQAFYLKDDQNFDWILKKFSPGKIPDAVYVNAIQPLIPHRPGLLSGYLRRVVSRKDVSNAGFFNAAFTSWIENTVLMPRIKSDDWATLADQIRTGSYQLTREERLLLCKSLSEQINLLERNDLAHRDLSSTNVFVEVGNTLTHLIDWDCIFHPSLSMPPNTTYGSDGYIAPFVKNSGNPDPHVTWRPHADRFSLAILNAEFLSMEIGTPLKNDGGMFEQSELFSRGGPEISQIINQLQNGFPDAVVLLERALQAQNFDQCPSPEDWLALSTQTSVASPNLARAFVHGAGSTSHSTSQFNSNHFVLLNEAALVQLDENAFVSVIQ